MPWSRTLILNAIFTLIAGCGYHPMTATFPAGNDTIYIPNVKNKTSYAGLTLCLTSALRKEAATLGLTVARSEADASHRLEVTIVNVNETGGMLAQEMGTLIQVDRIQSITVEASIRSAEGEALEPVKRFTQSGRSLSDPDTSSRLALADMKRVALLEELSSQIVIYMFVR